MKKILLLVCMMVMGYSLTVAQTVPSPKVPALTHALLNNHLTVRANDNTPFSSQGSALPYSYSESALASLSWSVGAYYKPIFMGILGQRVSLPTSKGAVDSIHVAFGTHIIPDSFYVALLPDTLLTMADGRSFHLINVINPNTEVYGLVKFAKADVVTGGLTTIAFDHVIVDKEFHVAFFAEYDEGQNTFLAYEVLGDKEEPRTLTTENVRSSIVAINAQQESIPYPLDSFFVANGASLYSNLLVTTFVETASSGVKAYGYQSNSALKAYPNPASDKITFITENAASTGNLELFDASGRTVWNGTVNGVRQIDVNELPSGVYHARYRSGSMSVTKTISVTH